MLGCKHTFRNATQCFLSLDLSYAHNFNLFIIKRQQFFSYRVVQCAQIELELQLLAD